MERVLRIIISYRMIPTMALTFTTILRGVDIDPAHVRLLRHKDQRADRGRTPYDLWRDDLSAFEMYQSTQSFHTRGKLDAPMWAVFLGTPQGDTLFGGLWRARYLGVNETSRRWPHVEGEDPAGTVDTYDLVSDDLLSDYSGRLVIEWGSGERAWVQYANRQEKRVLEIRRTFQEPEFPGYLRFREPLSRIRAMPRSWQAALRAVHGIYLLTCPRTREQYVGVAMGAGGFYGRWMEYVMTSHGGNLGLKIRDPADY